MLVATLALVAVVVVAVPALAQDDAGGFDVVPASVRQALGFDASESVGFFVGIRHFEDDALVEVPYAVDDAVDLAHLFSVELQLIEPAKIILSLAGEPQKQGSQERLEVLLEAGAVRHGAEQTDIYRLLSEIGNRSGPRGLLVVSLATHGFSHDGTDFLVASDSLRSRIQRTGVAVHELFHDISEAAAPRRLVLFDACRERLLAARSPAESAVAMSPTLVDAIAAAYGQVVLSGSSPGGYSYDDPYRQNGVFTAAVIDGLRGGAPSDERNFITVRQLAAFVDQRVKEWVRRHRPEHAGVSRGIAVGLDEPAVADMPLTIHPEQRRTNPEHRVDAALALLRQSIGEIVSGTMYDEVAALLRSELPPKSWLELVERIESLDGSDRREQALREWLSQRAKGLRVAAGLPARADDSAPITPQAGSVRTDPLLGLRFRFVPRGVFRMGSPVGEEGRGDDERQHDVTLTRDVWLAQTEVTQNQWKRVMAYNPSLFKGCGECPVENVSWYEALVFANRLSRLAQLATCYELTCEGRPGRRFSCTSAKLRGRDCEGYRLPTEAEWERAARAGDGGARYGPVADVLWHLGNSGGQPHWVGQKDPNDWNLFDLLGNVYEWTWDRLGPYQPGFVVDTQGPATGELRVFRGGSWDGYASGCRAANRQGARPESHYGYLGFRLARTTWE